MRYLLGILLIATGLLFTADRQEQVKQKAASAISKSISIFHQQPQRLYKSYGEYQYVSTVSKPAEIRYAVLTVPYLNQPDMLNMSAQPEQPAEQEKIVEITPASYKQAQASVDATAPVPPSSQYSPNVAPVNEPATPAQAAVPAYGSYSGNGSAGAAAYGSYQASGSAGSYSGYSGSAGSYSGYSGSAGSYSGYSGSAGTYGSYAGVGSHGSYSGYSGGAKKHGGLFGRWRARRAARFANGGGLFAHPVAYGNRGWQPIFRNGVCVNCY